MDTIKKNSSNEKFLEHIKSKLILKKIFDCLRENKKLKIIKVNKRIRNKLNIGLEDYKNYWRVEIEIIPTSKKDKYINFINIPKNENNYHIFFDEILPKLKELI